MPEIVEADICVIGGGAAGLSVAAGAAAFNTPVVLIEKGAMGGECLNTGCVPSKALIAAARRAYEARNSSAFGVSASRVEVDFSRVQAHVRRVVEAIAPHDSVERFTALGVRVIKAEGRFTDKQTVTAGDTIIKARRYVIATGSRPAIPSIPGLSDTPYLTNETIFENVKRPDHLIVLGGGPVGVELAQAHRRLGSAVTLIETYMIMAKDDPEAVQIVKDALILEGITILEGVAVKAAAPGAQGVQVTIVEKGAERVIEGSHLLVATGRKPTVEGLGLDTAGIAFTERGITVGRRLKTSNRRVYAIGDAIDGPKFTHAGGDQAEIVLKQILFRLPVRARSGVLPWATFTDPELAQVGLRDEEAKAIYKKIKVLRWPFHENDRAQTERATQGFVKVVTTRTGRIIGATLVGRDAAELSNLWSLAVSSRMNIRTLTRFISPYPTFSETAKRAAQTFFSASLTNPWVQRTLHALRRLG